MITLKLSNVNFDVIYMEALCNKLIKGRNLTRKEFTNIKTIINGMFDLAFRKHEIKENPMVNVRIMVKFRQVKRKTGETETYNTEELESLIQYLDSKYQETYAQRMDVKAKSSHKIRKTYASNLNVAGVPIKCCLQNWAHLGTLITYPKNKGTLEKSRIPS